MFKNVIPLSIVFLVIILGFTGFYIIVNQKEPNKTLDLKDQTVDEIFGKISPTRAIANNMNQNTQQQKPQNSLTKDYPVVNTTTLEDGLKIEDSVIGSGLEVKSGDTVTIHYLGAFENGVKFDSSYDRGQPFETQIGVGQVIKGWDEGVVGMKVGGKRRLTIPPQLGYGEQGVPGAIPPNSVLIFEVELLDVK